MKHFTFSDRAINRSRKKIESKKNFDIKYETPILILPEEIIKLIKDVKNKEIVISEK